MSAYKPVITGQRMIFDPDTIIERIKARVAMLNLNLAAELNHPTGRIAWEDEIEVPLLRYSFVGAVQHLAHKLKAWCSDIKWDDTHAIITMDTPEEESKLNTLIYHTSSEVIYRLMLADKLTFSAKELQAPLAQLRNEALTQADNLIIDMICALSIYAK